MWGLGQELELAGESKVLELPKGRLSTRRTSGNPTVKESIKQVA
jgi:hypothetical protein